MMASSSIKMFQKEYPLGYCAVRFLGQWQKREESLYKEISPNATKDSISNALAYFQVSRNFPDLKKDGNLKLEKARKALVEIKADKRHSTECEKVIKLSERFKKEFGSFNLSAASKLLWLSYRSPYIVYDKRAVTALKQKFNLKFNSHNYTEYVSAWKSVYTNVEADIEKAILTLPTGRAFMPETALTDSQLTDLANQPWFKERVFDIFLWEMGGK